MCLFGRPADIEAREPIKYCDEFINTTWLFPTLLEELFNGGNILVPCEEGVVFVDELNLSFGSFERTKALLSKVVVLLD